ncbi:ABC transporter permease [Frateuria soli]|uniref:ABC transporter permease n=1 Tax=Frateuria soli TaxID=1542730 RepID=UPI001E4A885F|nr:ABC transporter permease [Frateuria soli]UGB38551.1 ABC transporter permease [Frateuria soli]
MNVWLAEIARAWRASVRRPGFLLLASGVLALGIGASMAVLTLIQNTVLRPLPVPHAERVVVLGPRWDNGHVGGISPHEYQYLGPPEGLRSLGLAHFGAAVNIAGAGDPAQVPVIRIDRHLLPTLALRPVLGRNFSAQEDGPGGPRAVLLGYHLWQRVYGGDAGVVGRRLDIEGRPHTIIGVLPAAFNKLLGPGDVILPIALPVASRDYNHNGAIAIGRLADDVEVATVAAQADAHERAMFRDMGMGGNWARPRFGAEPLADAFQQQTQPMLMVFLASALIVLLIALVNLANLMLLRALSRNHDQAVRGALGAPLLRLMLPALGEGLLVGACGTLLGMALAAAALAILQGFIPAYWLWGGSIHIGAGAWLLAGGIGLLGALLAALLGLWRSRGASTLEELRQGGRNGIGSHSGRLSRALVVAQVALAAVLLGTAGVFMHALYDASRVQLGYDQHNVLTFELAPVRGDYPDMASVLDLSHRLEQRLRAVPGVTGAAVTTNLPTSDDNYGSFNNGMRTPAGDEFQAQLHGIGQGFLKLFAVPLREGRDFANGDVRGGEPVAIVSQDLAERYYRGHALGQVIDVEIPNGTPVRARIVGVVGATYQRGPLQPHQPVVYLPLAQMPAATMAVFRQFESLRFALRGRGNPADWSAGVRAAVAEVAPRQPIARLRTMHSIVLATTAEARLNLMLIGVFASLALLLAVAGLYAVMAVAVAARERELGVRLALGAPPARLARLVLRGGLLQIGLGLAIGIAATLGLSHAFMALPLMMLNGTRGFDASVVGGVCVALALAGLLACLLPALRAARVPPMRALRGE